VFKILHVAFTLFFETVFFQDFISGCNQEPGGVPSLPMLLHFMPCIQAIFFASSYLDVVESIMCIRLGLKGRTFKAKDYYLNAKARPRTWPPRPKSWTWLAMPRPRTSSVSTSLWFNSN